MRIAAVGATGVVLAGMLSGCGSLTLQGVPLPGGAALGSNPTEVTVQLRDALDLVPQASVKVNNVSVGEVRSLALDPKTWAADVQVVFNNSVHLPANAVAELKQTTLLGEKYVEIDAPTDVAPQGTLTTGATIPLSRTRRYPQTEEIFGALSMLLNGGGVGQLQNISHELNIALTGHETDTRALLDDLNTLSTTLDGQRGNITHALDGVDSLSATLVAQRANLDKVLVDLQPGLDVLRQQRPQLVHMLSALDHLSDVATDVVHRSKGDLHHDLDLLQPTLRELNASGESLPNSLQIITSPPFTDSAVGPAHGEYMNLNMKLNLNLQALLDIVAGSTASPQTAASSLLPPQISGLLTLPRAKSSGSAASGLIPGLGGN